MYHLIIVSLCSLRGVCEGLKSETFIDKICGVDDSGNCLILLHLDLNVSLVNLFHSISFISSLESSFLSLVHMCICTCGALKQYVNLISYSSLSPYINNGDIRLVCRVVCDDALCTSCDVVGIDSGLLILPSLCSHGNFQIVSSFLSSIGFSFLFLRLSILCGGYDRSTPSLIALLSFWCVLIVVVRFSFIAPFNLVLSLSISPPTCTLIIVCMHRWFGSASFWLCLIS